MITGHFDRDEPYVQGRVIIERLGVEDYVDFLVDTGAYSTVLHPMDGIRMNRRYDLLTGEPERVYGIGGSQDCYPTAATVVFADDDGESQFELIIDVVPPDPDCDAVVNQLPSLVGRDFINFRLLHYDHSDDLIRFY